MLQRLKVRLLRIAGRLVFGANSVIDVEAANGSKSAINMTELSVLSGLEATTAELNTVAAGVLTGSAVWNPGSLVDGAGESLDITVAGAEIGDFVIAAPGVDIVDITFSAAVTAPNTVTIRIQNESTATVDLASSTWNVIVFA